MIRREVALTIALALVGIAIAVGAGILAASLTTPSVGITDEPPSVSEELVEPREHGRAGARPTEGDRHEERVDGEETEDSDD